MTDAAGILRHVIGEFTFNFTVNLARQGYHLVLRVNLYVHTSRF